MRNRTHDLPACSIVRYINEGGLLGCLLLMAIQRDARTESLHTGFKITSNFTLPEHLIKIFGINFRSLRLN
jgi:hypothetical protein